MSQNAVVSKQVCLQQPFDLTRFSHCRILEGNEFHSPLEVVRFLQSWHGVQMFRFTYLLTY